MIRWEASINLPRTVHQIKIFATGCPWNQTNGELHCYASNIIMWKTRAKLMKTAVFEKNRRQSSNLLNVEDMPKSKTEFVAAFVDLTRQRI